jgi:hypothetical protein
MSSSKKLTCKGTLRQVFIRVYRLEIQSVMLVLVLASVWLEGGRGCWVLLETIFRRSLTLCIWPDSEPTKLPDRYKQKPGRGGGLRQVNACLKVLLQVNFFRWRHFALQTMQPRIYPPGYNLVCVGVQYCTVHIHETEWSRKANCTHLPSWIRRTTCASECPWCRPSGNPAALHCYPCHNKQYS